MNRTIKLQMFACCLLLGFPASVLAQPEQDSLAAAEAIVVEGLAEIQALLAEAPVYPYGTQHFQGAQLRMARPDEFAQAFDTATSSATYIDWWGRVIRKARQVQERWENNPYIEFEGFNVKVGFPPDITFKFKLKPQGS